MNRAILLAVAGFLLLGNLGATEPDPPEKVVAAFYAYLAAGDRQPPDQRGPDISTDEAAQKRWLTKELRKKLLRANQVIGSQQPKTDEVPTPEFDNTTIRFGWDPASKLEIVKSVVDSPARATVSGKMIWLPAQDYAGSVRDAAFILEKEDDHWKIADITAEPFQFDQSRRSLLELLQPYQ